MNDSKWKPYLRVTCGFHVAAISCLNSGLLRSVISRIVIPSSALQLETIATFLSGSVLPPIEKPILSKINQSHDINCLRCQCLQSLCWMLFICDVESFTLFFVSEFKSEFVWYWCVKSPYQVWAARKKSLLFQFYLNVLDRVPILATKFHYPDPSILQILLSEFHNLQVGVWISELFDSELVNIENSSLSH